MREDFDKMLTDRPRQGGCGNQRIRENRHETRQACDRMTYGEEVETNDFHNMKRLHSCKGWGDRKDFEYNRSLLVRYLKKNVGRKWDDVYSELSNALNHQNNSIHYHALRDVVSLLVETRTRMEGDRIVSSDISGYIVTSFNYYDVFYVDPRDGTLQFSPKKKFRSNKNEKSKNWYSDPRNRKIQYGKLNGIWYEIEFREATKEEKKDRNFLYDTGHPMEYNLKVQEIYDNDDTKNMYFFGGYCRPKDMYNYCAKKFGGAYLPIRKRQISSKEIRRIESLIEIRDSHKKKAG